METISVAAAVIEHRGRYLLLKRAAHKENPGMWEFPGGKVKEGESLQACLQRELLEELGVKAEVHELMGSSEMTQGEKNIRLHGLRAVLEAEPHKLTDHTEFQWAAPGDFVRYPMTAAELGLISALKNSMAKTVEIAGLDVWSCAKLYGVIYGVLGIFVGAFVFISTSAFPIPLALVSKVWIVVMLPFINLFIGALFGAVMALFYNFFASVAGGLKMRLK